MKNKLQKVLRLATLANYRCSCLRLRFKAPLGGALLLGLLLLNTTAAQASLVKVESFWQGQNSTNAFLNTTAFIEMTSFTGIGTETISLTSFDLVIGDLRPTHPDVFLTAELSPTDEVFVRFINGAVNTYSASRVGLDPGNTWFSINLSLGRLMREFPLIGQANYVLQPGSVVTLPSVSAVPLPASGILFLTAFAGLIGLRSRKRNPR